MASFFDEINMIEKEKLKPVYLLIGPDYFQKREITEAAIKSFGKCERENYYGGEKNDADFLQSLFSFGLFSSRKIIIYRDINKLTAAHKKKFLKYLEKPQEDILLILTAEKKQLSIISKISKTAKTIHVYTPFPSQYSGFVNRQINRMNFSIEPRALNLLVTSTNDSLSHTFAELEKILIRTGERKKIKFSDVQGVVGGEKKYEMWDFIDAIGNKNFYTAIKIGKTLIDSQVSITYIISSLSIFFINVWAYDSIHKNSNPKNFKQKQDVRRYNAGFLKYRGADFSVIIDKLLKADLQSKSVAISPDELLAPLIYEIFSA